MAWEEEGRITGGNNSFTGSHTRTFKMKVIHDRLPTATRKRRYQQTYPSTKCLYCQQEETTAHVLICRNTKANLSIILDNIKAPPELDSHTIRISFFHPDPEKQANLIRGLVPATWTTPSNTPYQTKKAAASIINSIINLFRKLIWNPRCSARKKWEKTNTQPYKGPKKEVRPTPAQAFIHDKLNAILHNNLDIPTWVSNKPLPIPFFPAVQIA